MVVIATYEPFFAISDIAASVFTYNINWHALQELPPPNGNNIINLNFNSDKYSKECRLNSLAATFLWKKEV